MVITSQDNAKVVEVSKLLDKKYRKATGRYVIEGERLVRDALKHGANVTDVFVKLGTEDKFDFENQIVVSEKVFAKMSDTVTSQGVLAVVQKPDKQPVAPIGNCLVLDGLQDPGNVGTLIRTAAASGFTDIYAVNCVDVFSPKVLRSAMSAHFCVNIWQTDDIRLVFDLLQHVQKVAADMHGESVFRASFAERVAIILGNEGNGLSEFSKAHADKTVCLPMQNNFESLNVAVAGSVIMYKIYEYTQK